MPSGIYKRTQKMKIGKNPNSRNGFKKGNQFGKMNIGREHSEATKEKIGNSSKGRISWLKGLKIDRNKYPKIGFQIGNKFGNGKRTKETRKKISKALNGFKHTKETKIKMGLLKRGVKLSERHKLKLRENNARYWLGKTRSEETKKKISINNKGKLSGDKHPNWQGGISFEPYSVDWTDTLKRSIRERDHYICQLCNQYGNTCHHIDYNKKNCSPENLITLCNKCNLRVNKNRDYWTNYFQNLIQIL